MWRLSACTGEVYYIPGRLPAPTIDVYELINLPPRSDIKKGIKHFDRSFIPFNALIICAINHYSLILSSSVRLMPDAIRITFNST